MSTQAEADYRFQNSESRHALSLIEHAQKYTLQNRFLLKRLQSQNTFGRNIGTHIVTQFGIQ